MPQRCREGDGVGQQALAEIGDGEHDERAQEDEACGEERRRRRRCAMRPRT